MLIRLWLMTERWLAGFIGAILCSTLCSASNSISFGGSADCFPRDSITVQIFFHRNHFDIDPNFSSNGDNLSVFFHSLDILSQKACIGIDSTVYIRSSSSIDGGSDYNLILSRQRASTLKQLFLNRSVFRPKEIDIQAVGEDWDKLADLLRASPLKYSGDALEIVENIPYAQYIDTMCSSHVLLDQIYSYSPAMNALIGMAHGLNVVSGGESDYYDFIGETSNRPVINAPTSLDGLVETLYDVCSHPGQIAQRGRLSREFVVKHNDTNTVTARYLEFWKVRAGIV